MEIERNRMTGRGLDYSGRKKWRDLEKTVMGLWVAKSSENSLSTEEHFSRTLLHARGLYEASYIEVAARYHFIANPALLT